jgi:hypothetical protein
MRLAFPVILIFLVAICLSQTNSTPNKDNKRPSRKQNAGSTQTNQQANNAIPINPPEDAASAGTKQTQDQNDLRDRTYSVDIKAEPTSNWTIAYVLVSGCLAAVGLGTLILLYQQMKVSHNAERGRLDIIFELMGNQDSPDFYFNVNNAGRSEIRIMDWSLYRYSAERSDPYIEPKRQIKPIFYEVRNAILHREKGSTLRTLAASTVFPREVREGEKIGYVTGVVNYIDIFDKRHYTRLAYKYDCGALMYMPETAEYK